jgi:hypothetical protein
MFSSIPCSPLAVARRYLGYFGLSGSGNWFSLCFPGLFLLFLDLPHYASGRATAPTSYTEAVPPLRVGRSRKPKIDLPYALAIVREQKISTRRPIVLSPRRSPTALRFTTPATPAWQCATPMPLARVHTLAGSSAARLDYSRSRIPSPDRTTSPRYE